MVAWRHHTFAYILYVSLAECGIQLVDEIARIITVFSGHIAEHKQIVDVFGSLCLSPFSILELFLYRLHWIPFDIGELFFY